MVFGDGEYNGDDDDDDDGPSLVAMATKFGTKLAITRLV